MAAQSNTPKTRIGLDLPLRTRSGFLAQRFGMSVMAKMAPELSDFAL